jgi:hypothetical protein
MLVAKLRLGNLSLSELRQALSRCSEGFTMEQDHNGLIGLVVNIYCSGESITDEELEAFFTGLNTQITEIRKAREDARLAALTSQSSVPVVSAGSSTKGAYRNRPPDRR